MAAKKRKVEGERLELLRELKAKADQNTCNLSVVGPRVLCGDGMSNRVRLWNWKTGKLLVDLPRSRFAVRHAHLHPDKRTAVVCYGNYDEGSEIYCQIWNLHKQVSNITIPLGTSDQTGMFCLKAYWVQDGQRLLTVHETEGLTLRHPVTGESLAEDTSMNQIICCTLSHDRSRIVLVCERNKKDVMCILDACSFQVLRELPLPDETRVYYVGFDAGMKNLLYLSANSFVIEIETGSVMNLHKIPHECLDGGYSGCFLGEGERILRGHNVNQLAIVNPESGEVIWKKRGKEEFCSGLELCEDGQHILTGGDRDGIRVWRWVRE